MFSAVNFCLQGSLVDLINRQIPNFYRPSPVWLEKNINGVQLYPIASYHPAIYADDGSFLLEPTRSNRLTWSKDFGQNVWIKGSRIALFPDEVLSADGTYQADKIAFIGGIGESVTMKRDLVLKSNTDHVFSILVSQEEGSVSNVTDVIRFSGDVVGNPSLSIEPLNGTIGKYKLLEIKFKTASVPDLNGSTYAANVLLEFYIESIVVLNISAVQLEEGAFRTSFILQDGYIKFREQSYLVYRKNPIQDARNCGIFVSVNKWSGNGNIINAGNLSIEIANDKLVCKAGGLTYVHDQELPDSFKVFIQASQDNLAFTTYIDGILVDTQSLAVFIGSSSPMSLTTTGLRRIGSVIITNKTLLDEQKTVGQPAKNDIYDLFNDPVIIDSFVLSADPPIVALPEVSIPANIPPQYAYASASSRFPFTPSAQQAILAIDLPTKRLTVSSASSFVPGKAFIHTILYEDVTEVIITAVDQQNNYLIVDIVSGINAEHIISQPLDEMSIAPSNYYAGLLTPIDGVEILATYMNGIVIKNTNEAEVRCAPYIRVYL